jgi:Protein of unknown function (DUF1360)
MKAITATNGGSKRWFADNCYGRKAKRKRASVLERRRHFVIYSSLRDFHGVILSYGRFDFEGLGFFDLVVLGLATFRVIHLITYDRILDFARVAVMDSNASQLKTAERGWRRVVCELMQCLWCAGLWSALIVVTIYLLGFWGRLAIVILAVAGLGSLLQVVSKAIAGEN